MESNNYTKTGFSLLKNYFSIQELSLLKTIILKFHNQWLISNDEAFKNGAINSHSLTSSPFITPEYRLYLFDFISQDKILDLILPHFQNEVMFLNTQLFFDPFLKQQKNYWHRDIQYTGKSIEEQHASFSKNHVMHVRIPLQPELGIELIPYSHIYWDTVIEYNTRMGLEGRTPSDSLESGLKLSLEPSDVLLFSANMIHRGLYGGDRLTFDILYCDASKEFLPFVDINNHPTADEINLLKNRSIFLCT